MRAIGALGILLMIALAFVALRLLAGPSNDLTIAEIAFFTVVTGGCLYAVLLKLGDRATKRYPNLGFILMESYVVLYMGLLIATLWSSQLDALLAASIAAGVTVGILFREKIQSRKLLWYAVSTSVIVTALVGILYCLKYGDAFSLRESLRHLDLEMRLLPAIAILVSRAQDTHTYRMKQKACALSQTHPSA